MRVADTSFGVLLATSTDDGRIGIPPTPSIIEGFWQMTPTEMEEQIKNLNHWTREVAQFLPLLATKEDLKAFATNEDLKAYATKEDLRDAVAKLATKEDLEAAKRYSENLTLATRHQIRQVDQKVDALGRQVDALGRQLKDVAGDVKNIAEQVAILTARERKKK